MPHNRLQLMLDAMATAPPEVLPSKFWAELNKRNLRQLDESGYGNFKRTLARNYFTWLPGLRDDQLAYLARRVAPLEMVRSVVAALTTPRHSLFTLGESVMYTLLTKLIWLYASREARRAGLDSLSEPEEGNPPRVIQAGRVISQDMANAGLEFDSIMEGIGASDDVRTIIELGAGYGRTAFVFLRSLPRLRYVVADLPPALYVSERYLTSQFGEDGVFRFREFGQYQEVERELESSRLAFLLPHQLRLLPSGTADLFTNISSLHEMRQEQIRYFIDIIDRITKGYVYLKQWKVSHLPYDGSTIAESDYPIPDRWEQVFWRTCRVQSRFFEALFRVRRGQQLP